MDNQAQLEAGWTTEIVEEIVPPRQIAYTLKDAQLGDFAVVESVNAWWGERRKVEKLIDAFKAGATRKGACVYAGISIDQYKYFREIHPEFSTIKAACKEVQIFRFLNKLNSEGIDDLPTVRWYLERMHPDFASKAKVDEEDGEVLQPMTTVINNFAPVGVQINASEISNALREIAREVFGASEADSEAAAAESMAMVSRSEPE